MHPRPEYHFTPPQNWMNDPNGLIFDEGRYHLYYQHNPSGNEFGNISWGHATSLDLISWEHASVALKATDKIMIFSGCVVKNEKGRLCAIYTEHEGDSENYRERICLAESGDRGFTFDQSTRKVILEHEDPDFRDPKVFWHAQSAAWIMCVALPKRYTIQFYRSGNLLDWTLSGEFSNDRCQGQFWECPEIFCLTNENEADVWILSISGENADGVSWGMFYFAGQFDGYGFKAELDARPIDIGSDFYAGITFEGTVERVMIGWCGNWAYANRQATLGWKGMLSTPRKLHFRKGQLIQELISERAPETLTVETAAKEILIQSGLLRWSNELVQIDRSTSPLYFPEELQQVSYHGPVRSLNLYVDVGIVECVINNGEQVMTVRI